MIVAAHQPNYLPWLGFFDKWARADVLVLLDDVQFPRTGAGVWTNRVRVLLGGEPRWLTVPISRAGRSVQLVSEVEIDESQRWREKQLRSLEHGYAKARAFDETFPLVHRLIETRAERLADYNERNLRELGTALGLPTSKLVRSSSLGASPSGTDLLVELTRAVDGTTYLSGDGAGGYQDERRFEAAGIELRFQRYEHPVYPQLAENHVAGLSIVDALLNCGVDGTRALVA